MKYGVKACIKNMESGVKLLYKNMESIKRTRKRPGFCMSRQERKLLLSSSWKDWSFCITGDYLPHEA